MDSDAVMAGMVLYESDYNRLKECLAALNGQVVTTIMYDNSPNEMEEQEKAFLLSNYKCEYVFAGDNLGMPAAMNRILEIADQRGYGWVLTMNADSVVPANLIDEFKVFWKQKDIGMICPQVIDRRRKYMQLDNSVHEKYIDMCITSGACTRVESWKQVGGFDEWLFVDLLDNDISKRMVLNKWRILQVNSVVLDQEFGDIQHKTKWKQDFWIRMGKLLKNENFAKFSYKKNVHVNRVYYTCRNVIYLNKKFCNYGGIGYKENYNCNSFPGFLVCFVLPSILRAKKKLEVIKAVFKGFLDGRKKAKKTVPWVANPIQ